MNVGAIFPTTEIGDDPDVIRDWAQAAEELGYSHIVFYDHVLGARHADRSPPFIGPYTEHDPFHEPLVVMSFIAAATERIGLATGILILPQRQTVLVAKQAAELDLLSKGRLRLGIGTGWNYIEYESLGADYRTRGRRLDEQVDVLRKLWREPVIDYNGDFHRIDRAGMLPKSHSPIPIWFGGFTDVAFRRAARLGDGFIYGSKPSRMAPMLDRIHDLLDQNGRDPAEFGGEALVDFSASPDTWGPELELWQEKGGSHLSLRMMDTAAAFVGERVVGYAGPQSYIDGLERFMRNIR
jgi:probable F420-dependent oxidoreductase